ncbi:MAG: cytochrome c oxidase accessory protein CcoG [Alphaproteobacteria bacterium 64-11]|nr:cytochrome c oxidase accessory protein CcoG [Alphaproteobacteria bacterium]OJU13530.1 MAG: cytochrome c oxidase accessory protein CcoG [Alphaproteobacteria bacterium 64-11]
MTAHTVIDRLGGGQQAAEGVARSDAQATNSAANRKLYKPRVPIHPREQDGVYRKIKWAMMAVTLSIYYLIPWVRWDRGPDAPDQAVLVDFAHQRFYFFFIEIWPQEVYYITGLLILAAVSLFLVNALFGRLWCGYSCPQTVWTDLFIWVETKIEGDRNARIKLDAAPWTANKIVKRVSKHAIWLMFAVATGGAWVFYYNDAPTLLHQLLTGTASIGNYAFIGILAFTTYSLGGLMREQVCTYMCPWPRIQAAMSDKESLTVTYRSDRGEPRGAHKKGDPWEDRGSCIDCNQCVAACPMGIDIRDGAQLECINCGLCIDACDDVMKKIGQPARLIAYDTDANIQRRLKGEKTRFRFLRPRTMFYAAVLVIVSAVMLFTLATRRTIDMDVLRDRNPNYVTLADGAVRNGYTVKLLNLSSSARDFHLAVSGLKTREVKVIGLETDIMPAILHVPADKVRTVRVLVTVAKADLGTAGSRDITFTVTEPVHGQVRAVGQVFATGVAQ